MNPRTNTSAPKWTYLVGFFLVALLALVSYNAYHTMQTTGIVTVNTSDKLSTITLSADRTTAAVIGTGSASVRLKPGSYLLVAGHAGQSASQVITVTAKQSQTVKLSLTQPQAVPSPDAINFDNVDTLLDFGLTQAQTENAKQLFFKYKQSAKQININSDSVKQEPHDPHGNEDFKLDFSGTIDGAPFNAVITYGAFDDIQMTLVDPATGAELFSGTTAPTLQDN
jgi:hypothetical protein